MPRDVLHDHDRVIDHEADGNRQPAHRHQVDRLPRDPHQEERREHGERQRHRCHEGEAPVAQEQQEHDDSEQAPEEDRVTDVRHGSGHEFGEVVRLREPKPGGERAAKRRELRLDALPHGEHVGAHLLRHADGHRRPPVARYERRPVGRPGLNLGDVAHADGGAIAHDDGRGGDCGRRLEEPGCEHEVLQARRRITADRRQDVGFFQRGGHVLHGESGSEQARRIRDDLDLPRVRCEHFHAAHARHSRQVGAHDVERVVAQVGHGQRAREIQAQDGKGCGRQTLGGEIGLRGKLAACLRDPALGLLHRDRHVGGGIELRGDLAGAPERGGSHAADAGHLHHRLLERARDSEHHRACGRRAGMRDDHEARELQGRVDVARQRSAGDEAEGCDQQREHHDRARLCRDETIQHHGLTVIAAPSGSASCPLTITRSPAARPERISTSLPEARPTLTVFRCAF